MLSNYAKREWLTLVAVGVMLAITSLIFGLWWLAVIILLVTMALLSFFRDPKRDILGQRGVMVSPADGRVTSIFQIDHFEPIGGPATCVRIFLSVFNVHVNRSPCHGMVESVVHQSGQHRNTLNPNAADVNESTLITLIHPVKQYPVAAVRQIAGMLARTVVCGVKVGDTLQCGQRFGIIKLGSTTELYIPDDLSPEVTVKPDQKVVGGITILANVTTSQAPGRA